MELKNLEKYSDKEINEMINDLESLVVRLKNERIRRRYIRETEQQSEERTK